MGNNFHTAVNEKKLRKVGLCFTTTCFIKPFKIIINHFSFNRSFYSQLGKGEAISLNPFCNFQQLHRQLDIKRFIAAESSTLHIAGSRNRTRNLYFPSPSC